MASDRFARVRELLLAVADLGEAERSAFLDEACKDDPELRREVESILAHEGDATGIVYTAGAARTQLDSHPDSIGPYKILEPVGEGGMGVVYLAEQTEPVRRRVAVKVIKLGMDTKQVVARFEAERQALAMMDHPNIATVLDAGATPDGRPYFVMEHVQGISITDYCDRHELKMPKRLELFTQICEAIQHAHQKGVIHRDLKPSNVLVEVQEDRAVPKVIDFGVAKATAQRLTERTIYTEQGQLIGTPEYMSPEQAEMTGLNVDTRTDIYSLGVLLYELMVGALPFEPETLRRASYAEIQRILREVDPPRPSTRLSSLGASRDTVAKRRKTDRSSLLGQLRGDLDWITMKALEKDRTRRYASASEFAADIHRFLNDEPVVARPPSPAYRARKYIKRHRVAVGFAATIFLAMAVGFIVVTTQQSRTAAARDEAVRARDEAVLAIGSLEEMLASADPTKGGLDVTVKEMLDETAKTLGERFKDQPLVEARLRRTVGNTYYALGDYTTAEEHLRRVTEVRRTILGREDLETLEAWCDLGKAIQRQGRYDEAEDLAKESLEIARRVLGEEHAQTVLAMHALAAANHGQGRLDDALKLNREILEIRRRTLGNQHEQTLLTMGNLAAGFHNQGRYEEAGVLQRETLEIQRRTLGDEHPQTLLNVNNLALTYQNLNQEEEAEALYKRALATSRRVLGKEHPSSVLLLRNLAMLYGKQGRRDEVEMLYRALLEAQVRVWGKEQLETLRTMKWLAASIWYQGRLDEAQTLEREALEISRRVLGERHIETNNIRYNLACGMALRGRPHDAVSYLRAAVDNGFRTICEHYPYPCPTLQHANWSILDDTDFSSLHGEPDFEAIVEELRRMNEEGEPAEGEEQRSVGAQ